MARHYTGDGPGLGHRPDRTVDPGEIVVSTMTGRKYRFSGRPAAFVARLKTAESRGVSEREFPDVRLGVVVDRLNQIGIAVESRSDPDQPWEHVYVLRTQLVEMSRKTPEEVAGAAGEPDERPEPADHGETVLAVLRKGWRIVEAPGGYKIQRVIDRPDGPEWIDVNDRPLVGDDLLRVYSDRVGAMSDAEIGTVRGIQWRAPTGGSPWADEGMAVDLDPDDEDEEDERAEPAPPLVPGRPVVEPFADQDVEAVDDDDGDDADADHYEDTAPTPAPVVVKSKQKRARPRPAPV